MVQSSLCCGAGDAEADGGGGCCARLRLLLGPVFWREHFIFVFSLHLILCWVLRDFLYSELDWIPGEPPRAQRAAAARALSRRGVGGAGIRQCLIQDCKQKQIVLRVRRAAALARDPTRGRPVSEARAAAASCR